MSSDNEELEVYNLTEQVRLYRNGFEAALRWLDRDYRHDAMENHSLSGFNYSEEYLSDMADIRRARRALK